MLFSGSLSFDRVFAAVTAASCAGSVFAAGTFSDSVVEYAPGTISSASLQQSGNAGIGLPAAVDDGQTTPFTPPFHAASITIVGAGGHITLHFANPVTPVNGPDIGVFTNTGLAATTSSGTITSTTTGSGLPGVFSTDAASISVSADNITWIPLNAGAPFDLTMPSNAFVDTTLTSSGGIHGAGGVTPSDPFRPLNASLSQFAGLTYPQMVTVFNGSWGGAWVDASSSGLAEINYIRFDVGAGQRLVLDAVTAAASVPEPGSLATVGAGLACLSLRRPKRRVARVFSTIYRSGHSMKSAMIVAGAMGLLAAMSSVRADVFTMNGQAYTVEHVTGSGPDHAILELDYGTNAAPDAHLFGFAWDDTVTPHEDGRTMVMALQADGTGITYTDTYFPQFGSYLLNKLWLGALQPKDDYPNSFWDYFSNGDGATWTLTDFGYDQTPVVPGNFYAWALQLDDPNINFDYTDPNAVMKAPDHIPAAISAVPEPASLIILGCSSMLLLFGRKR